MIGSDENQYTDLIAPLHAGKPKFVQTVYETTQPNLDTQAALAALIQAFDLDTAVGVQLDAVALRVGATRDISIPSGTAPIFGLDREDSSVSGFDVGICDASPVNSVGAIIVPLTDDQLRLYIRAKIAANSWDGTVTSAAAIYANLFPGLLVLIQDNQDMSMVVSISGTIPTILTETLLLNGYLPLKPEGVSQSNVITTVDNTPIFGLDVENQYIAGFDVGACDRVLGTA